MRLFLLLLAAASLSAFAADTTVKGYLVDIACSSDLGDRPGFGARHSKKCLQMLPCAQSGYGVLTEDKHVIKFDDKGNEQAKKFIESITKTNDIRVNVTGSVDGDHITVNKIELQ
ncbi:MAG TPA: hypothetical protein VHA33_12145 [Candidatus Angelobacter sp.]|jgi:hypothetical protein|nr:hypothetical protein [Candidatus Angelobacter sp.]